MQNALHSYSFSYLNVLYSLLITSLFLLRNLFKDLFAGAIFGLLAQVGKNDLIEVRGQIGYFLSRDWRTFSVLVGTERKQYPNRILLLPDFYKLKQEVQTEVAFEIDIPTKLGLDNARILLSQMLQATPYVLNYEEESAVKSIKPGYSYHVQLTIVTFESYVWSVCENLHSQVGHTLEEQTNAATQTRYNLQIK